MNCPFCKGIGFVKGGDTCPHCVDEGLNPIGLGPLEFIKIAESDKIVPVLSQGNDKPEIDFWVMDGRANFDIDRAIVLVAGNDTLEEAMEYIDDYGADTCIVKKNYTTGEQVLVYSKSWKK